MAVRTHIETNAARKAKATLALSARHADHGQARTDT